LETYTEPKDLVENPHFQEQRHKALAGLSDDMIDGPLIGLIHSMNRLAYCFTLQCCYGHFVTAGQKDPHNLEPLPAGDALDRVEYRVAYVCLCVESSDAGKALLEVLKRATAIDPQNVQFCCAQWFWDRQVNSYALQVQPDRFKHKDTAMLAFREALRIEKIRNQFFETLEKSLPEPQAEAGPV
jgi:hypothetical protein